MHDTGAIALGRRRLALKNAMSKALSVIFHERASYLFIIAAVVFAIVQHLYIKIEREIYRLLTATTRRKKTL